jgi:hypothetical protein
MKLIEVPVLGYKKLMAEQQSFWHRCFSRELITRSVYTQGGPRIELAQIELKHAKEMQQLAAGGPNYLKFYSLIAKHAADLSALTYEVAGVFLGMGQHSGQGCNPVIGLGLYTRRLVLARRIISK